MALTNFFYWMLAYGSVPEKIAAVSASEDIFIQICARVGPALMRNYAMSSEEVAFFTAHEEIGEQVTPIDALVLARYDTAEDRQRITRAVRLSHEFELLFYDTLRPPRHECTGVPVAHSPLPIGSRETTGSW
jgi:thiaminase/transcriptional activator TenA